MITEKDIEKLKEYVNVRFQEASLSGDTFDIEHEVDKTLTYEEAKREIEEKVRDLIGASLKTLVKEQKVAGEVKEMQEASWNNFKEEHKEEYDNPIDLDKIRSLAIIGNIDSGKSNLAFYYLNSYNGKRQKVLFGYPKKVKGFLSCYTWQDLTKIKNSIIFIDEVHRYIRTYENKNNTKLMELISLFSHKNNTLIFTTQLTQFINRGVEAFIDCWAIKRIDLDTLKNGCKPKKLIQRCADWKRNDWVFDLEKNEYFEYCDKNDFFENKIKRFPCQNIAKDWA